MKFSIKEILPYLAIVVSLGATWGMWSERLEAVESKADTVARMQIDIAVIKQQIISMEDKLGFIEEYLIKTDDSLY